MIFSEARGKVVDYLGTHQHLAVDIDLAVGNKGGMQLFAGAQRFYEGAIVFRFPLLFSGRADVCEWFDDATGKFQIEVKVVNPVWGALFGYRGSFEVEYRPTLVGDIPAGVKPLRGERRE